MSQNSHPNGAPDFGPDQSQPAGQPQEQRSRQYTSQQQGQPHNQPPGPAAPNRTPGIAPGGPGRVNPQRGQRPAPGGPAGHDRFRPPTQTDNHTPGSQPGQQAWPGMRDHTGGQIHQQTYAEGRFAPSNTQALRVRHRVEQNQGAPASAPWTTQAIAANPAKDPGSKGDLIRLIVLGVIGAFLLLGFVGLVLYFAIGVGSLTLIMVTMMLSFLPLAFIILMVIWFDRWKRQPAIAMVTAVMWGGVASVFLTLAVRTPFDVFFAGVSDENVTATWEILGTVAVAPILEEITKGLFLVGLVLAARRWFEGPLDGWVYGSLIGAGFAFTENILYLSNAFMTGAMAGSLITATLSLGITFFMRCIMSPLLHSTFVVCAGISIGFAARRKQWWLVILMWIPGLLLGMFLHAAWNGTSVLLSGAGLGFFSTLLIMGGMSLVVSALWLGSGIYLQYNEAKQTRANLGDYANAGWMTHAEVDMMGTFKGRRAGKQWAKNYPGALPYMKQMIKISADLATTRMRVVSGVGGDAERQREKFLLESFTKNRREMMKSVARASNQVPHRNMHGGQNLNPQGAPVMSAPQGGHMMSGPQGAGHMSGPQHGQGVRTGYTGQTMPAQQEAQLRAHQFQPNQQGPQQGQTPGAQAPYMPQPGQASQPVQHQQHSDRQPQPPRQAPHPPQQPGQGQF